MSRIGEHIAWKLNQWIPQLQIHSTLEKAKRDVRYNQQWSFEEAKRVVSIFGTYWNEVRGKNILDIGTGVGGKIPFYIETGAKTVTGVDIRHDNVITTQRYLEELGIVQNNPVTLIQCDAAQMPFSKNAFEIIISINVFEHIMHLEEALQETYRVLKPGGLVFLHLPPYFGPWGPHLENWIHFPWPHLLFSDKTLLSVVAREDARLHLNDEFHPAAQIDVTETSIPNVNKVTIREFLSLLKNAGFHIKFARFLSVGYDVLGQDTSRLKRLIYQLLQIGCRIPILQEVLVTKMVYVLVKPV